MNSLRSAWCWLLGGLLVPFIPAIGQPQINYLADGAPPDHTAIENRSVSIFATNARGSVQWQMLKKESQAWVDLADDSTYQGTKTNSLEVASATAALDGQAYRYTDTVDGLVSASNALYLRVVPPLLAEPSGLAMDANGNMLVADASTHVVWQVTGGRLFGWGNPEACSLAPWAGRAGQAGALDGNAAAALFNHPGGLAATGLNTFVLADTGNGTIRKLNDTLVTTLAGDSTERGSTDGAARIARFSDPIGVAAAKDGTIFVADSTNHVIRKIAPNGTVSTFAGSAGMAGWTDGTGPAARFNHPTGVGLDAGGNVFVADTNNNLIRKISPAGVVTTLAGVPGVAGSSDGAGSQALFSRPTGLWVHSSGFMYVADTGNSTIRTIGTDGVVSTYAGMPTVSGLQDGVPRGVPDGEGHVRYVMDTVLFNHPTALAADGTGLLFIADTGNAAIRVISQYDGWCLTLPLQPGLPRPADVSAPASPTTPPSAVTPPTPSTPVPADSPGGGGAPSEWFLTVLAGACLLRRLTSGR